MKSAESTKVIDEFITQYRREFDFYNEAARLAHIQLQAALGSNGIQAIVSYRAKNPERLRKKLYSRSEEREYANFQAIYDDIVDLAGVRVALYFPGLRDEVGRLINQMFSVGQEVTFPRKEKEPNSSYTKEFSGYSAMHYRVNLTNEHVPYSAARVEIQVASVLMHAWSEVDHDLIYKPLQGEVSHEEYAILDQLNGLVLSGEIALRSLQRAIQTRLDNYEAPFNNKYELSGFLLKNAASVLHESANDSGLGRVDILFRVMQIKHQNKTGLIKSFIEKLEPAMDRNTVSSQIISMLMWNEMRAPHLWNIIEREFGVGQSAVNSAMPSDGANRDALAAKYIERMKELESALLLRYPDEVLPISEKRLRELGTPEHMVASISRYRAIGRDSDGIKASGIHDASNWLSSLNGFLVSMSSNFEAAPQGI